jgi:hypothetical protein
LRGKVTQVATHIHSNGFFNFYMSLFQKPLQVFLFLFGRKENTFVLPFQFMVFVFTYYGMKHSIPF